MFEICILAHDLILHSSGPHTVNSGFFDHWIVNLLGHLKALANIGAVFQNHVDVVLHGVKITEVHIEVIKKVGCVTKNVLTDRCDNVIIDDSLSADVVPDMLELRFLNQGKLLFLNHKAIVHVSDELH